MADTMLSTWRFSVTWWARNTRAPSQAQTVVAARVPASRSSTGAPVVSPTKSLFDTDTRLGQPPGDLQGVPGVLAEVMRRIDEDPVAFHPCRQRAGRQRQRHLQHITD